MTAPNPDLPECDAGPDLALIVSAEPLLLELDRADIFMTIAERRAYVAGDAAVERVRSIHAFVTQHLQNRALRPDSIMLVRQRVGDLEARLLRLTADMR